MRQTAVAKHDERRAQLSESALATLAELGYAKASLREIANNSPFSHGVVHYYFSSKNELIVHSVREYKRVCVTRYDDIVADASSADELADRMADRLAQTLVEDEGMHRLWYDVRTATMFDDELRPDILEVDGWLLAMIERIINRYAELAGRPLLYDSATAYALFDGVFERAVLDRRTGGDLVAETLRLRSRGLFAAMLG